MLWTRANQVWGRVFCAIVSTASLLFVFTTLDLGRLWHTLNAAQPAWCAAAVLAYGCLFLPAARRWHLVLGLTKQTVSGKSTLQAILVGHFFYLIFFGAIGGDAMRSGWYARKCGLPIPSVLATAPVDRVLGFVGLLLLGAITAGLAIASEAFTGIDTLRLRWPGAGIIIAVLLLAAAGILLARAKPETSARSFLESLRQNARLLLKSPRIALQGVACGVLVQSALSGTLALNLQAVSNEAVPWAELAWTFPLIALVGALPITVAGLGVRETAALGLLAIYGIGPEQAVAASLLTMSANVTWGAVGGLVWLHASLGGSEHWTTRLNTLHRA